MSKPMYVKDPITGAVIFHDENAYSNRKKVLQQQKEKNVLANDTKTVINSLRNEVTELKHLVESLLKNKEL